jgi:hypothetical protein
MDADRIKKWARREAQTGQGQLRAWWTRRYEATAASKPFEQRTAGDLLREYYFDAAIELDRLKAQQKAEGHSAELEVKIGDLERLFSGEESELQSLDAEASEENWLIPRRTGDPMADEWERQIAAGQAPNLDD